jgi:hypothetical protein
MNLVTRAAFGIQCGGDNEGDLVVSRAGAFLREGDQVRAIVGDGASGREPR